MPTPMGCESLVDQFGHAAAEGHDGDETRFREGEREIAVGPLVGIRVDDTLAVGAKDPHPVFFSNFQAVILRWPRLRDRPPKNRRN